MVGNGELQALPFLLGRPGGVAREGGGSNDSSNSGVSQYFSERSLLTVRFSEIREFGLYIGRGPIQ